MLAVEIPRAAPVLGEARIPVRPVPAEGGGQEDAGREFFAREIVCAAGEQPDRGKKKGAMRGGDLAAAIVGDAQPRPGGGVLRLAWRLGGQFAAGKRNADAPAGGAEFGSGEARELACGGDLRGMGIGWMGDAF